MATTAGRPTVSSSASPSFQSTNIASHRRRLTPLPLHASLIPILSSCYLKPSSGASTFGMRAWLSSGPEVRNFKLPPPVNPPDAENPDKATLRAQWDSAVKLYGRMYSHAWGTAVLAGVSLFGLGWWIKGENPLKGLSSTGELKKEAQD